MATNPFSIVRNPVARNTSIPWYMGGGGSGGPLGAGPFPAAPALNRTLPPWDPSMAGGPQAFSPGPAAMAAPDAQKPFNALLDPERPGLLGFLGAMMGNPTRGEYNTEKVGRAQSTGLQTLGSAIQAGSQNGIPIQKTILNWVATPEGAKFIATSPDPSAELKNFLGITVPEPNPAAGRAESFANAGGPAAPAATVGAGFADPAAMGAQIPGLEPGRSQQDYLAVAEERANAGDDDGANIALKMAEEARLAGTAIEEASSTEWIKNYRFYVGQELASGKVPESFDDWKMKQTRAGVPAASGEPINPALVAHSLKLRGEADLMEQQSVEALQFRELAKGVDTGWMQSMTLPFKQALQSIGIKTDDIPEGELINALSNQMALRLRNPESGFGLTGNTSNFDIQFLRAAVAGLDKTPEGNYIVLTILHGRMRRAELLKRAEADYVFQKGNDQSKWSEFRKELIETTPLLYDDEVAIINAIRKTNGMQGITISEDGKVVSDNGSMLYDPITKVNNLDSWVSQSQPTATPESRMQDLPPIPKDFFPNDLPNIRQDAWQEFQKGNKAKEQTLPDTKGDFPRPKKSRSK